MARRGFLVYVRELEAKRIAFELGFNGYMEDATAAELVQSIEDTFCLASVHSSSAETKEDILNLWKKYNLPNIEYGRA